MFTEIFHKLTGSPKEELSLHPFTPYPSASDRAAWQALPDSLKEALVKNGRAFLNYEYPVLRATDYMDFCRTGNRQRYQERLFNRRIALNHLILAECVEYEGRFLDDILNGIFVICEEAAWQLPAHNSYIRDTPQLLLPDVNRPVVDLFAAETGAVLACAGYLLKDALNKVSPVVLGMIGRNLEIRIFTPYLKEHFWWMGDGKSHMNNWTSWCTQNVLMAAAFYQGWSGLLSASGSLPIKAVLEKSCQSLDYFLDEYGTDGCCDEGAQYYRHAGLTLFGAMEVLNGITENAFSALYKEEKICNIASYIFHVHVAGPYYVNFADCSPIAGRCGAREFLFGKRTQNPELMTFAAKDYLESDDQLIYDEHNLFYHLQAVFTHQELLDWDISRPLSYPDLYYPSAGVFLARDENLCLAVKAGDNDDSHNHNDVGSFTVYKDGKPLFIDVGVETYQKKTFSPDRYEIWTMQSRFHNLPVFGDDTGIIAGDNIPLTAGGIIQKAGESYCASQVDIEFGADSSRISMEIAPAYGDARILSYRRTAVLHKAGTDCPSESASANAPKGPSITITDTYKTQGLPVTLSLMTYEKPVLTSPDCLAVGNLAICQIAGASHIAIEAIPITDQRLKGAWKHEIYRCLVTLPSDCGESVIIIR